MSTPVFGVSGVPATLSALGNTSVTVNVTETLGGVTAPITTAQTVTFTSNCAASGRAILSPSVVTVNGVAIASYRDNGCASTDTITASIAGGLAPSTTANLIVTPPAIGSIQYVSAMPLSVSLKGMGGVGRQETSQVVFRVVDAGGLPVAGKTVSFALNTTVGGITLSTPNAISDALGQVYVTVNAGTVSTPVRVTASTTTNTGTILTSQSDQLTITTGIPDQQNFSLSATTLNIEGWGIDGALTTITARLADHFGNPVLDGTTVNFTCEGGCSIGASCNTVAGSCSVPLTSLAGAIAKPLNGRVSVLAYAVGEEGFTDLNGNGMADQLITKQLAPQPPSPEMIDTNLVSTDTPEAWVDYNENLVRDLTEPFIDFNVNGLYDAADTNYNGVLCDHTLAPGTPNAANPTVSLACSAKQTLHVFKRAVIVLSSSVPAPLIFTPVSLNLGGCVGGAVGAGGSTSVMITDVNLNLMPAGTIIAVGTTDGVLTTPSSYVVPNSIATNIVGLSGIYAPAIGAYTIGVRSDATVTPATATTPATCTDATTSGFLTLTITTPGAGGVGGTATTYSIPVIN